MSKRVSFVELPVLSGVVPLASGYMEAFCRQNSMLTSSFQFEKISLGVKTPYDEVLATLEQGSADVYAFSCYVWNSGLVRRLLDALLISRPQSYFMLGGPQVMHQGIQYLNSKHENVFVCNGEGERTFANFLQALALPAPDFSTVRNLSFYRNGKLMTAEPEPRISDLSEIPSPFLEGMFELNKYS